MLVWTRFKEMPWITVSWENILQAVSGTERQLPSQVRQYGQYNAERLSLRWAIKMRNGNCPNQSEDTQRSPSGDIKCLNDPNIRWEIHLHIVRGKNFPTKDDILASNSRRKSSNSSSSIHPASERKIAEGIHRNHRNLVGFLFGQGQTNRTLGGKGG